MTTYSATAVREGRWWVITVPDIGTTQGRSTAEARRMAADMIAVMVEVPLDEVTVEIDWQAPAELADEVAAARAATAQAAEAQQAAARLARSAVAHLIEAGLSKQDTARVLKVAPQRISQLTEAS